jgi:hypothetical protein
MKQVTCYLLWVHGKAALRRRYAYINRSFLLPSYLCPSFTFRSSLRPPSTRPPNLSFLPAMPLLLDFILDHTLAISGTFVALYVILYALYQLCFSPLCDIPGPWYAAISDFWLTTHVLRLQQCRTIDSLFAKYGPVVRVGPNKVVFNDLPTTRNVYSILKFDKSKYYKSLLTFAHSLLSSGSFSSYMLQE